MRKETDKQNELIANGIYAIVDNPKENLIAPKKKEAVPYFNFAPVENALNNLNKQSTKFTKVSRNGVANVNNKTALNKLLKDMERALTKEHGLPKRPWYKHHIYAPGFYTGYGVKTLPGVREAIEQREFDEVEKQVNILAEVINNFSSKIEEAVKLMK